MNSSRVWLALLMLLSLAGTAFLTSRSSNAAGPLYVVAVEVALLREYPAPESGIVDRLQNLDQVEYLENNASGWWKVRSLRSDKVGWMTADLLSSAPPAPPPTAPAKPEYAFANRPFNLRTIPLSSAEVSGSVNLNDPLEKVSSSPAGWTKVRNPRNATRGWIPTDYLSSNIVTHPPPAYPKKRFKRALPHKKKKLEVLPAPEKAKPM